MIILSEGTLHEEGAIAGAWGVVTSEVQKFAIGDVNRHERKQREELLHLVWEEEFPPYFADLRADR